MKPLHSNRDFLCWLGCHWVQHKHESAGAIHHEHFAGSTRLSIVVVRWPMLQSSVVVQLQKARSFCFLFPSAIRGCGSHAHFMFTAPTNAGILVAASSPLSLMNAICASSPARKLLAHVPGLADQAGSPLGNPGKHCSLWLWMLGHD